jgi:hypothetical protein
MMGQPAFCRGVLVTTPDSLIKQVRRIPGRTVIVPTFLLVRSNESPAGRIPGERKVYLTGLLPL